MPTLQEVAEAKKNWEAMKLALEEQQKVDKEKPQEKEEKSAREKELEEEIRKLKAKSNKTEGFAQKMLNLLKSSSPKEEVEDKKEQDVKEDNKESEGFVTKKEFLALQEQLKDSQWERFMDNHDVPKDKKSRNYFMFLLGEHGDKEPSEADIEEIVKEVKSKSTAPKIKKAEAKEEPEEEPEQETQESKEEEPIPITQGTGKRIKGAKSKVTNPQESKSLKQFRNMGSGERAMFKEKNPEMYEKLHKLDLAEGFWQEKAVGEPFYDKGGGILGPL